MPFDAPQSLPSPAAASRSAATAEFGYVSCIKIDGVPIMPPVMTDQRRVSMRRLRDQAIECERRLAQQRCPNHLKAPPPPPAPRSRLATPDFQHGNLLSVTGLAVGDHQQRYALAASVVASICRSGSSDTNDNESTHQHTQQPASSSANSSFNASTTLGNVSDITADLPTIEDRHHFEAGDSSPGGGGADASSSESSSRQTTAFVYNVLNASHNQSQPGDPDDTDRSSSSSSSSAADQRPLLVRQRTFDTSAQPCSNDLTCSETNVGDATTCSAPAGDDAEIATARSAQQRLIRSNSYTLLTPSPAFLKHLRDQGLVLNVRRPQSVETSPASAAAPRSGEAIVNLQLAEQPHQQHQQRLAPYADSVAKRRSVAHKSHDSLAATIGGGGGSKPQRPQWSTKPLRPTHMAQSISASGGSTKRPSVERIYGVHASLKKPTPSTHSACNRKSSSTSTPRQSPMPQALQQPRVRRPSDPKPPPQPKNALHARSPAAVAATLSHSQTTIISVNADTPTAAPVSVAVATSTTATATTEADNGSDIMQLIARMEVDRRRQMDELIARQAAEQQRLQAAFMQQQQLLVEQITAHCTSMIDRLAVDQRPKETASTTAADVRNNNCDSAATTPRPTTTQHRLVAAHQAATAIADGVRSPSDSARNSSAATAAQRRLFAADSADRVALQQPSARETAAATRIQAGVRGFLVRRLFRTEDVQSVVQVIRDTLLFVVDLYREQQTRTEQQRPLSEMDLNLRRSLLKQLNSSCYLLNDIFIRKSIAERMEIISTDRRILQRRAAKESRAVAQVAARLKGYALMPPQLPVRDQPAKSPAPRPQQPQQQRLAHLAKVTL